MSRGGVLHGVLSDITDFCFPRICHICGEKLSPGEDQVCTPCLSSLPRTLYHRRHDNPMEQRFAGKFPFERATGLLFYSRDSALAKLIIAMKYKRFKGVGRMLGRLAASELYPSGFFDGIDSIMPVPMHFMKKALRGYNQAEEIAHGLSEGTGIPLSTNLKAVKGHKTQTALSGDERLSNMSGIFSLKHPELYENRGVLIVDDICTTGATLTAAADTLVGEAPSVAVSLLTIGVTF